jgi:ribosomal protein S18 acetylase RimI-like enzyme
MCYGEPWAELTELYVQVAYRRRGLGRMLVEYAEAIARQHGATAINLLVNASNVSGQSLYRALGYCLKREVSFEKQLSP